MLALNDHQLKLVMTAAAYLPVERRGAFLETVAAELHDRPADLAAAVRQALAALREPAV
jgi:hypothetical protein